MNLWTLRKYFCFKFKVKKTYFYSENRSQLKRMLLAYAVRNIFTFTKLQEDSGQLIVRASELLSHYYYFRVGMYSVLLKYKAPI